MLQTTFLYYLVQIAHYQSLSIAAEELHVSQPALSSGIKKLEEQLGVKLLERTYKGVTLTSEGKEVVALAEKAFGYLNEIENKFQKLETTNDTQTLLDDVIIYTHPSYTPVLMTELSKHYGTQKSIRTLQIFNTAPHDDIGKLIDSSNNIVVLSILPENYQLPNNINATILRKSKSFIMCSKEFPHISPKQTSVAMKDLVHLPLVLSKTSFEFQTILLNMLRQYGEPNIVALTPDSYSVTSIVQSGVAVSFTNNFFISQTTEQLRQYPIRNAPTFHLCLLYGNNIDQSAIDSLKSIIEPVLV